MLYVPCINAFTFQVISRALPVGLMRRLNNMYARSQVPWKWLPCKTKGYLSTEHGIDIRKESETSELQNLYNSLFYKRLNNFVH
jgi:hypothetical protein